MIGIGWYCYGDNWSANYLAVAVSVNEIKDIELLCSSKIPPTENVAAYIVSFTQSVKHSHPGFSIEFSARTDDRSMNNWLYRVVKEIYPFHLTKCESHAAMIAIQAIYVGLGEIESQVVLPSKVEYRHYVKV